MRALCTSHLYHGLIAWLSFPRVTSTGSGSLGFEDGNDGLGGMERHLYTFT